MSATSPTGPHSQFSGSAAGGAAAGGKDTVYVDVDDEITHVIDKVKNSPHKIVALVLPKRATVLQSIVNMKLLKRGAEQGHKSIVLITSEAGLMPLAGVVGLHVAKTLQSKPVIPPIPDRGGDVSEIGEDELDKHAPIGALAAGAAAGAAVGGAAGGYAAMAGDDDVIELDNVNTDVGDAATPPTKQGRFSKRSGKPNGKNKRIKVPNFDRFRVLLIAGIAALILLIVGWYYAAVISPHATVVIKTDSAAITTTVPFTVSVATKTVDINGKILPAEYKEVKKTDTQKVTATGQKDNGTKATGTMTVYNCANDNNDVTLPAGTTFTNSGYSFVTGDSVTVPASDFNSPASGGACKKNKSAGIAVTAAAAGDKFNLNSGRSYTTSFSSTVTGTGSAMTGGTSQIITVVQQSDIDGAKSAMKGRLDDQAKTDLKGQLDADGYFPLQDTFTVSDPAVTSSSQVGDQAADVTVTAITTYGMLGVKQADLSTLVKKSVDGQIDKSKQVILDDGVVNASFVLVTRKDSNNATMTMQATATAGPQLDAKAIANSIKGMAKPDAQKLILARPGIKDVTITYSPFWVFSTPKAAKKITVKFEKPEKKTTTQSTDATSSNP